MRYAFNALTESQVLDSQIKILQPQIRYMVAAMLTDQEKALDFISHKASQTPQGKEVIRMSQEIGRVANTEFSYKRILKLLKSFYEEDHQYMAQLTQKEIMHNIGNFIEEMMRGRNR